MRYLLIFTCLFWHLTALATDQIVDLVISNKVVNFVNKSSSKAIAVNDQIPAPTLHFKKGDQPGETFQYRFTLHQSGTYWYHAHAGAQEQDGLYRAFLIDPSAPSPYQYSKDYVIVLSDWSNSKRGIMYLSARYWFH